MRWKHWVLVAASVGVVIGSLYLAGANPGDAGKALFRGSLGSPSAISGTLRETTPLLIAGIAVFIALQAGLFNIGVEGQLIVGALACTAIGLKFPGGAGVVLGILGAMVVGGLWALPAGLIRAYRGGHEVITTIMLNSVAIFVTNAIVSGPLRDTHQESPATPLLSENTRLPWLYHTQTLQISSGIIFGLVLLVAFAYCLKKLVGGYELRAVGANWRAARLAGVSTQNTIVWSMAVSGAVAGLGGAVEVFGYTGYFYSDFSSGYGFSALGVALLAGANPIGIIPSALFFGMLSKGSAALQILGVPKGASLIVLGILIAVFAAVRYRRLTSIVEG